MLRFQFPADSLSRVFGGHTLLLKGQGPRLYSLDQVSFRCYQRTVPGSAVIGQHMGRVESGYLLQHREPCRRCSAIAIDKRHGLVLHHVA